VRSRAARESARGPSAAPAGETVDQGGGPPELRALLGLMPRPVGKITFAPQPLKFGLQWHVIGTYPGGQQEHITGFKTEASALDWIANDSRDWLIKRGYEDE
jgi:hypothetical protein